MTLDELYAALSKLRDTFLGKLQKIPGHPVLSPDDVVAYLGEVRKIIAGHTLDPNRPAVDLSGCAFNGAAWPPGEYPGLDIRNTLFMQHVGARLDRHFASIHVKGALYLSGQIQGKRDDLLISNVVVDGPLHLQVAMQQGNLMLQRVTCSGPATTTSMCIGSVTDCVFKDGITWIGNSWRRLDNVSVIPIRNVLCETVFGLESNVFDGDLDFSGSTFRGRVVFDNLLFPGTVDFRGVNLGEASFRRAQFKGRALFGGARFRDADFSNAIFSDSTSFNQARFDRAPLFHGATLHPDTVFDRAKFHSHRHPSDWPAYRTLREMLGKLGAGAEESEFFVHEQRAQVWREIKRIGAWPSVLASLLYWAFSRYGQSIARPVTWLIVLNLSFSVLYCILGGFSDSTDYQGKWRNDIPPAIGLMWQNLLNPFGFLGKAMPYQIDSAAVAAWSATQSLFSGLLLALLVLAVRRRFRKVAE